MSGVCAPIKRAARSACKLPAIAFAGFCAAALPTQAHPHVFVDGGGEFVVRDGKILEAVKVTWLYDPFETLYILSSYELSLNDQGDLSEGDRQTLVTHRSQWPSDFDGSTHLTRDGEVVPLSRPIGFDAALVNGQLQVTFTRVLETPIDLNASNIDVLVYEATYFYAFSVSTPSRVLGFAAGCNTDVIPFNPGEQDSALQAALAKLSREETPEQEEVGAIFADRIRIRCA